MAISLVRNRSRWILIAASALIFLSGSISQASGQRNRIVVKMASLAPVGTTWHDQLKIMGQRWSEASNGQVVLQIIPNAAGGEEVDVIRKMRYREFQAGTFSLAGLQYLTPAVSVLAIPMLAETQEDLHRIRDALGPKIEAVFEEKGYVLLHWADLGWMRFFTQESDPSPDAVRDNTYVQWGDSSMDHLWRAAGFPPGVRLNMADITVGLERGHVEAINTAPMVVGAYQWFAYLDYIIDVRWAPLSGATLIDKRTWERIPADLRPVLKRIAEETGETVQASLLEWEENIIRQMTEQGGLEVITPPPEVMAEWTRVFLEARTMLRGDVIPEEWFDEALRVAGEGGGR